MRGKVQVLESGKVRLIPLASEHEAEFLRLANIPEINQRVNKPFPYMLTHFAEQLGSLQKNKNYFVWVIEHEGAIIGVINTADPRDKHLFQGGYWIDPEHWGKGIASVAVRLVKEFLFKECGAVRVQALVEPDNLASIRVLEKCGYDREGLLKKFYSSVSRGLVDVLMYAVVR